MFVENCPILSVGAGSKPARAGSDRRPHPAHRFARAPLPRGGALADADRQNRSIDPRSLPPCPPPTRRGRKRFAPLCGAIFYKGGAKRRNLLSLPLGGGGAKRRKGGLPRRGKRRRRRQMRAWLDCITTPAASRLSPTWEGLKRLQYQSGSDKTHQPRSSCPLLVGGGQGGSERWMTEWFRQIAPAPDTPAPPRSGTAAKRQMWSRWVLYTLSQISLIVCTANGKSSVVVPSSIRTASGS